MAWKPTESAELYGVANWSGGYFEVAGDGHVVARPDGPLNPNGPRIDLFELMGQIRRRGISTPLIVRFDGILRSRARQIAAAFERARAEYDYPAPYRGVFPIKVNQQRHVVETLLDGGRPPALGLEVGSKPELLAALALKTHDDMLLVCNGYKDREYVETALLSRKLGLETILVVEKFSELETVLRASRALDIEPAIGVRTKLWGKGSGRWMESGGDRSKFGLTTRQIVQLVERLGSQDLLGCLQLLHFHVGSQVTDIRAIKNALREATRVYVELARLGAALRWFDVGGGLGIDYDGSSSSFESSVNYTLEEYADDVVFQISEACREAGLEPPTLVSESGRALTAHHAVLVTEVLGVSAYTGVGAPIVPAREEHEVLAQLSELHESVCEKNFQATYHDAQQFRDEAMTLFAVGQLGLRERARVEDLYWRICRRILEITRRQEYVPEDLASLERDLADTYFLNTSIFQSLPDSWAIRQLFPILPLHRLDERPSRRGILADITCDSDGKIDRFIDLRDVKRTLELHDLRPDEPYYLGAFLVGAYQEILGDMHNLFGDPNIVHVDVDEDGRPRLTHVVRGDRTQEVLSYVEYYEGDLFGSLRRNIELAIAGGRMTYEESALLLGRYEAGLASYTYLGGAGAERPVPVPAPGAGSGR